MLVEATTSYARKVYALINPASNKPSRTLFGRYFFKSSIRP
jgi:hypothetical protein